MRHTTYTGFGHHRALHIVELLGWRISFSFPYIELPRIWNIVRVRRSDP